MITTVVTSLHVGMPNTVHWVALLTPETQGGGGERGASVQVPPAREGWRKCEKMPEGANLRGSGRASSGQQP